MTSGIVTERPTLRQATAVYAVRERPAADAPVLRGDGERMTLVRSGRTAEDRCDDQVRMTDASLAQDEPGLAAGRTAVLPRPTLAETVPPLGTAPPLIIQTGG